MSDRAQPSKVLRAPPGFAQATDDVVDEEVVVHYDIVSDNVCDPVDVVAIHNGVIVVKHDENRLGEHAFHASGAS